jgi:hypothetical protein
MVQGRVHCTIELMPQPAATTRQPYRCGAPAAIHGLTSCPAYRAGGGALLQVPRED